MVQVAWQGKNFVENIVLEEQIFLEMLQVAWQGKDFVYR